MRVLYLDCSMGAAGDMLMAALYELLEGKQAFLDKMAALGLPGIEISPEPAVKCGVAGTHMQVLVRGEEELDAMHEREHHHAHTTLHDIEHILSHLALPQAVREDALSVYRRIAEAESTVHGMPVDQIHFHEVGTLDALADVVGVCLLMHLLAPEKIYASSVHVGCGQVHCAHGILPVPAPATALLLTGVPIYGGAILGELCTPTGAALLTHFVTEFGTMPAMKLLRSGYGMGTKDFPAANCVRAMLGESERPAEQIVELSCNLDDCTGEAIGFASEQLLQAGALDVYTTQVLMKKNRPGVLLTCMCKPSDREKMLSLLFRHTTTLGVREAVFRRYTLSRQTQTLETEHGPVRVKISEGYGVTKRKPEFEDLAKIARETGASLLDIQKSLQ